MGYRDNIINNIRGKRGHPLRNGVKMQAHHLLSKRGIKLTGLKGDLEHLGYDINKKENLVLLPCTLKGACHLGVQLHRGNHTATADIDIFSGNDNTDADTYHDLKYHLLVVTLVQEIRIDRNKGRLCKKQKQRVQEELDDLSETMLGAIKTFAIPLTSIHASFLPLAKSGCCGKDVIGEASALLDKPGSKPVCPSQRSHKGQEGIRHRGKPYLLKVGQ